MKDDQAREELNNFANANRFDRQAFRDDTHFADWVQSRARRALAELAAQPAEATPPESVARLLATLRKSAQDGQNYVGAAADMIEKLTVRAERSEQDAARYRFLRDIGDPSVWERIQMCGPGVETDAAIDEAMAASQRGDKT